MPFEKGNPGKPKGIKHKKTVLLEETAARLKCDPFKILCLFANGDWKALGYENECYFSEKPDGAVNMGYVIAPEMRLHAAKEAVKYLYAQKRSVEVIADITNSNPKEEEEVKELVDWLKQLKEME